MKKEDNMYKNAFTWNPAKGCLFKCPYCKVSYKKQSMRHRKICKHKNKAGESMCYTYEPHFHYERLWDSLPLTKGDQFIWCCSSGDISFYPELWIKIILERIKKLKNRTFFFQTKDPRCFMKYDFPENVILGITLETNRVEGYDKRILAPDPVKRQKAFKVVIHPRRTITIEPIMEFDLDILLDMAREIGPYWVAVGYESHNLKPKLPEPPIDKTYELISELRKFTRVEVKYIPGAV